MQGRLAHASAIRDMLPTLTAEMRRARPKHRRTVRVERRPTGFKEWQRGILEVRRAGVEHALPEGGWVTAT
jgi:hypothetical protein